MFEHEVRHCYHDQLQSLTTTGKVCDMTRKKLLPREDDLSIPMEEFSIRPIENSKHYAPRPMDNNSPNDPPEQEAEMVNQDPSLEAARRQYVEFTHRTTGMPIELINQFVDNFPVFNVPANFLPNYFALGGAPFDANNGVLPRQNPTFQNFSAVFLRDSDCEHIITWSTVDENDLKSRKTTN
ncbi:unnamed protein product [Caenorhabditis nigoni]